MAKPLFGFSLELKPKSVIKVVVDISPKAKRFTIDLGKGGPDIALHFNPRFNYLGLHNVTVLNTLEKGRFGKSTNEKHFPFQKGTRTEVSILFDGNFFTVKMPDGYEVSFPNRTKATVINYVGVHGDILVRSLAFE